MIKHRQFLLCSLPSSSHLSGQSSGWVDAHNRYPWQWLELPCATLMTCQGNRAHRRLGNGALLSISNIPCSAAPPHLYINSLDHLCIENKSVCFVRKACKIAGWSPGSKFSSLHREGRTGSIPLDLAWKERLLGMAKREKRGHPQQEQKVVPHLWAWPS